MPAAKDEMAKCNDKANLYRTWLRASDLLAAAASSPSQMMLLSLAQMVPCCLSCSMRTPIACMWGMMACTAHMAWLTLTLAGSLCEMRWSTASPLLVAMHVDKSHYGSCLPTYGQCLIYKP